MKIQYQNKHLKEQVKNHAAMLHFFIFMELVGFFLCFLSYFHAYMDLKYEREMPFDHLPGLFSYAVYTAEITEMPEEVYPSYYMVKMGDNALMVSRHKSMLQMTTASSRSTAASFTPMSLMSVRVTASTPMAASSLTAVRSM